MKYHNKPTILYGIKFHSKKEAEYSIILNDMIRKKEIISYQMQFPMHLEVNGEKITKYIADFLITKPDGSQEIHETKGYFTKDGKIKWKLAQALYKDKYKFILIQ